MSKQVQLCSAFLQDNDEVWLNLIKLRQLGSSCDLAMKGLGLRWQYSYHLYIFRSNRVKKRMAFESMIVSDLRGFHDFSEFHIKRNLKYIETFLYGI